MKKAKMTIDEIVREEPVPAFVIPMTQNKQRMIVVKVRSLVDELKYHRCHPNPIIQRPPVYARLDNEKYAGIIECILFNRTIGQLTVRDISDDTDPCNEPIMYRDYAGYTGLCIDGGNRMRAIQAFVEGEVGIVIPGHPKEKIYWVDLTPEQKDIFLDRDVAINYVTCTSLEAYEMFIALNKQTGLQKYEFIMANEASYYCRMIRMLTRTYSECQHVKNPIYTRKVGKVVRTEHPIYEVRFEKSGEIATYFKSPNEKGWWWWYAWTVLMKVLGGGNVVSSELRAKELIESETPKTELSTKHKKEIVRFHDELQDYQDDLQQYIHGNSKLDKNAFFYFQNVWFELFARYGKDFAFDRTLEGFATKMINAIGKMKKSRETISLPWAEKDALPVAITEVIKSFPTACSKPHEQSFFAIQLLKTMGVHDIRDAHQLRAAGIIVKDKKRSEKSDVVAQLLISQNFKCIVAADVCSMKGAHLKVEDCHYAHLMPHSKGGKTEDANGAAACTCCNLEMGSMSVSEYEDHVRAGRPSRSKKGKIKDKYQKQLQK